MTEPDPDEPMAVGESPLVRRWSKWMDDHGWDTDVEPDEDAFPGEVEATLEEQRERRWASKMPQRFIRATVDDFKGAVRDELVQWAHWPQGRNLVVVGPVGTGKTHAAIAACRIAHDHGLDVAFWPLVDLLQALRPGGDEDLLGLVRDLDRLILDDLGAERMTEWAAEQVYAIVNARWLDEIPTVFTTNLDPDALADMLGERMYSRVVGGAVAVRLTGKDRRRT